MPNLIFIMYSKGFGVIDDVIGPHLKKNEFFTTFQYYGVTTQMTTTPCKEFRLDIFVNVWRHFGVMPP